jgi:hypothetical protein
VLPKAPKLRISDQVSLLGPVDTGLDWTDSGLPPTVGVLGPPEVRICKLEARQSGNSGGCERAVRSTLWNKGVLLELLLSALLYPFTLLVMAVRVL